MGVTFLIAAGAAICLVALYITATHAVPALVSDNTLVGLHDPAAETLVGGGEPARIEWQLATVQSLTDAEEMLDGLEARGFQERELVVMGNSSFAVRWR